ncbi:MAG: deoxyribonuclease IV [Desulfococcaceae bacterium]
MPHPQILLGAHVSVAGGLPKGMERAAGYGCAVAQIFSKSARTWKETEIAEADALAFREARKAAGVRALVSHAAYLINLATPESAARKRSISALIGEMKRSAALGAEWVVVHPGAHKGAGEAEGIRLVAEAVGHVLADSPTDSQQAPRLLLETTAGQGTGVGHAFEQLGEMLNLLGWPDQVGVCLDTSHVFAAGYDIRTEAGYAETMESLDRTVGLDRLGVLHLNDSKTKLGSKVDRHAHIGRGEIGEAAFRRIMNDPRLAHVPKIIETPKGEGKDDPDWDRVNLGLLRGMVAGYSSNA